MAFGWERVRLSHPPRILPESQFYAYTNEEKYLVEFSSRFNSTSRREEGVERAPQPMINTEFGVNMPKRHLQHAKPNHLTYIKINLPESFLSWYYHWCPVLLY